MGLTDAKVGAIYLQQQPGLKGLVRYLGVEAGSHAFLDLLSGKTLYHLHVSHAELIREMTVHEVVAWRKGNAE